MANSYPTCDAWIVTETYLGNSITCPNNLQFIDVEEAATFAFTNLDPAVIAEFLAAGFIASSILSLSVWGVSTLVNMFNRN